MLPSPIGSGHRPPLRSGGVLYERQAVLAGIEAKSTMRPVATDYTIRLADVGGLASPASGLARVSRSPILDVSRPTWAILVPLLLLAVLTAVFRCSQADVAICRWFYGGAELRWHFRQSEPWLTLYRFGTWPGLAMGIGSVVVVVASYLWKSLRPWRNVGLFLSLLLALGPGLIINGILKPQWSRPRPQQIRDFGGQYAFIGVWGFGPRGVSKSFPCGHASMGFYLMAPAFLLYRRNPHWAMFFVLIGLASGGILGLARVAQGQHFPSDVLWSGGMVYLSGLLLTFLFGLASRDAILAELPENRPVILSIESARQRAISSVEEEIAASQPGRKAA